MTVAREGTSLVTQAVYLLDIMFASSKIYSKAFRVLTASDI